MTKLLKPIFVLSLMCFTSIWLFADDDEHEGRGRNLSYRSLPAMPTNPVWKSECASCHQLYHPGLLPQRSWQKMMGGLKNHFGENASLDDKAKQEIEKFLVANSAENSDNRRARKFLQSIGSTETPLRISETAYFKRKHSEISSATFQRKSIGSAANCMACHANAEKGYFDEHEVKIPKQ